LVVVRRWTEADIDYVTESVMREGWGYIKRDIERCWHYEPNGCFIAEAKGDPVGHVFSICYGKTGWIGLLIVDPMERGKGIGAVLTQAAIDYLQHVGVETIRLEAVERAVALYRRLGFREEFYSLRFSKQLKRKEIQKASSENVFPMRQKDLEEIAEFDSRFFGANRLRVLQSLYKDQPQNCFVASEKQKLLGYLMSRKISKIHRIGPWVSQNPIMAERLLNACMEAVGGEETELRLGMPILNEEGLRLIEELAFQQTSKSIRMAWGKQRHRGRITGIYGIGGPEKG